MPEEEGLGRISSDTGCAGVCDKEDLEGYALKMVKMMREEGERLAASYVNFYFQTVQW